MSALSPKPVDAPANRTGRSSARWGMAKVMAATLLFGAAHSLLAGTWAKAQAVRLVGQATADALYRPFYLLQSLALLGLLVLYARRQPGRDLYQARGLIAWALRAGQAAAIAGLAWAAFSVGLNHLLGWDSLEAWWQGAADVPPMPDGQEPSPAQDGAMRTDGPLGYTRHPLNWLLLPLFWLNPRMTTRLLAFNLVVTAYLVAGSLHAEAHMLRTYGEAYRAYQEQVPFFAPAP